jgi:hypothetical protein
MGSKPEDNSVLKEAQSKFSQAEEVMAAMRAADKRSEWTNRESEDAPYESNAG